ncbi:TonB-dependent receptor [Bacteroides reticulotermitis]|uniref:TonB-dependent receptor n=4 Tax=Bacteroides reticulotermitis TaxID=1133319 RepID=W4UWM6_9BACE|nr:TonB-dependent receptor [Bacteroides reticulotermitis]MBB4045842.1 outer membrane receptor protein involved in Fe transport [Bacteroides reticulotermitis]GAE85351.1 TonB-dependent receptor [Bacteroides reticulotermitis JCM 10512]HJD74897.1 TonB-dependent receptor [Bacteroides reticulotermitis]
MNKNCILLALTFLTTGTAWAEDNLKDSIKVVDIEEVVIIATPKENRKLREQPMSVTLMSQKDMQANQVTSIKSLSGLIPNLFIPDYGSKLTTSMYIRGVGSRINTPSVGLYVDNIPYIDKSAFDFSYADIERIDILRGPQGTLYGRNTMGGLIKVHTKSPFTYQGTDIRMGAATYNNYNVSLTHYHRISDTFAFSTGGFYEHTGGFFENSALNNRKIDRSNAGGGRFRGIYMPTSNLKVDMTLSYEYDDQGGYPYEYTGVVKGEETRSEYIGKISYNEPSSYRRGLLNAGVNLEYQGRNFILSAVTGYQNLNDRMFLDQDFTEKNIYTLEQKQRGNTISEEVTFKSKPGRNWQWATGASGFYQWLHTTGPVQFGQEGVQTMIEDNVNNVFENLVGNVPGAPKLRMDVNNSTLSVGGRFDTPILNGAVYHQSTYNNLLIEGLSATVGLRLEYEKIKLDYNSIADPLNFDFSAIMPPPRPTITSKGLEAPASFVGKISTDYLQLLPKFALQYEWNKGNSVYATVSKGHRSGGYNIQMFSDIAQGGMQNAALDALAQDKNFASFSAMLEKQKKELPDIKEATQYKPEYSWSYEVGSHLTLWEGKLWADLAAFYMDTRDQQISQFAPSGLGRITVNAGKSRSYGAEASLRASLTSALSLNASYGYTYATFTDYVTNQKQDAETLGTSYNGNYVPFVPKHTLNIGGEYAITCSPRSLFDRVVFQANYVGAGRIYWTEQNNASQAFYGTLNGRVNLEVGDAMISFWTRNFLDKDYNAFYFETMNKGFAQQGRPAQFGIDLRCRF